MRFIIQYQIFIQIDPGPNPDFFTTSGLHPAEIQRRTPGFGRTVLASMLVAGFHVTVTVKEKCTCLHNTHLSSLALTSLP